MWRFHSHYKPLSSVLLLPEHLDESRDAAGFENGEEALPVVGEVVQCASSAACRLHVSRVLHGPHDGGHHLRGAHNGVPRCFLLRQLMHHDGRLVHHHLQRETVDG